MSQFKHLYRTNRWKVLSLNHRRHEPLCRMCKAMGKVTAGKITDHVLGHPVTETEEQFWAGPFQTLCPEHHESDKKRIELGSERIGCDADGWPIASPAKPAQIWRK